MKTCTMASLSAIIRPAARSSFDSEVRAMAGNVEHTGRVARGWAKVMPRVWKPMMIHKGFGMPL